jgi:hypothetical protein
MLSVLLSDIDPKVELQVGHIILNLYLWRNLFSYNIFKILTSPVPTNADLSFKQLILLFWELLLKNASFIFGNYL